MEQNIKVIAILILTSTVLLSACGSDEPTSSQEKQLKKLSATWVVTNVTGDGTDYTDEYRDFELTLSGSSNSSVYAYGVLGRPEISPWPSGGTWVFGTDVKTTITRDSGTSDQLAIAYSVTDSQLTIMFSFSGDGYESSRVNSVSGNWTYTFVKK